MRANAHAVLLAAALALAARGADAQQQQPWPASVTEEMFCTAWVKRDYCWARGSEDCPAAHCRLENYDDGANRWQSCVTKAQDNDVWDQYRNEVDQLTQHADDFDARQSSLRLAGAPNAVERWHFVESGGLDCSANETVCINTRGCEWSEHHYSDNDRRMECGRSHGFELVVAYEACGSYDFSAFEEGRGVFDVIASYQFGNYDGLVGMDSAYDRFECQTKCERVGNHRRTCEQTYGCEYDADAGACFSPVGFQPCRHTTRPPGAWPTAEDVCPSIRDELMCMYSWDRSRCEDTGGICAYGPSPHEPDRDCDDAHSPCWCQIASEKSRRTNQEFSSAVSNVGYHGGNHDCWSINDEASCVGHCTWRWGGCQISYETTDAALRDDGASDIALAYNRVRIHNLIGDCWSIRDQRTCDSTAGCSSHMGWEGEPTGPPEFMECMSHDANEITELKEACAGTSADFSPVEEAYHNPGYGGGEYDFYPSNFGGYSPGEWPTANEICPVFRDQITCEMFNLQKQLGAADARCDPDVCQFGDPYIGVSTECDDSPGGFCYCHVANEANRRTWEEFDMAIWHARDGAEMDCMWHNDENSCSSNEDCTWHSVWCGASVEVTERALRDAGASTIALAVNRIFHHQDNERCAGSVSQCASKDGCAIMSDEYSDNRWCVPEPDRIVAAAREACAGAGTDFSDAEAAASDRRLVYDDDSAANDPPIVAAAPLLFAAAIFPRAAYL